MKTQFKLRYLPIAAFVLAGMTAMAMANFNEPNVYNMSTIPDSPQWQTITGATPQCSEKADLECIGFQAIPGGPVTGIVYGAIE